jgi:hypothetical protein
VIKLSELKAARQKMSDGEFVLGSMYDGPEDQILAMPSENPVADLRESSNPVADAAGIIATHNAADVLIEIVEVALAWRDNAVDEAVPISTDHALKLIAALAKVSL